MCLKDHNDIISGWLDYGLNMYIVSRKKAVGLQYMFDICKDNVFTTFREQIPQTMSKIGM